MSAIFKILTNFASCVLFGFYLYVFVFAFFIMYCSFSVLFRMILSKCLFSAQFPYVIRKECLMVSCWHVHPCVYLSANNISVNWRIFMPSSEVEAIFNVAFRNCVWQHRLLKSMQCIDVKQQHIDRKKFIFGFQSDSDE
jgi:hypothetical protein